MGRAEISYFSGKKRIYLIFCVSLLAIILNVLCQEIRKEGYYIDELRPYGLANSYYMPFLQEQEDYPDHWHGEGFYKNYLTAGEGETFSFASVYDNQVHDVHPPLYYFLLHFVCSLFEGDFPNDLLFPSTFFFSEELCG